MLTPGAFHGSVAYPATDFDRAAGDLARLRETSAARAGDPSLAAAQHYYEWRYWGAQSRVAPALWYTDLTYDELKLLRLAPRAGKYPPSDPTWADLFLTIYAAWQGASDDDVESPSCPSRLSGQRGIR